MFNRAKIYCGSAAIFSPSSKRFLTVIVGSIPQGSNTAAGERRIRPGLHPGRNSADDIKGVAGYQPSISASGLSLPQEVTVCSRGGLECPDVVDTHNTLKQVSYTCIS